jgi:hypothetical protein
MDKWQAENVSKSESSSRKARDSEPHFHIKTESTIIYKVKDPRYLQTSDLSNSFLVHVV